MKTCPICSGKLHVSNSRDIENCHERHTSSPMMLKADDCGITQGIIRERKCADCGKLLYTHEVVFHLGNITEKGYTI
jgi:hypothetical protein